eukprot:CAMPEP_0182580068 /NCGR_PEP_ID=MMETSP1324-20130603/45893_1 /TAXON_ID=236786 /ORGANISM="Florenciella sp., Strain RCC1587" /LENGTH=104 /DNA_ID=CAMNT_0024796241 /DNA_START=129 /DNA_END=443 /DNA_ORIENTATION=-
MLRKLVHVEISRQRQSPLPTSPAPGRRVGVQISRIGKPVRLWAPAHHVVAKVRQHPITTIQPFTGGEAEAKRDEGQDLPRVHRQNNKQGGCGNLALRLPCALVV